MGSSVDSSRLAGPVRGSVPSDHQQPMLEDQAATCTTRLHPGTAAWGRTTAAAAASMRPVPGATGGEVRPSSIREMAPTSRRSVSSSRSPSAGSANHRVRIAPSVEIALSSRSVAGRPPRHKGRRAGGSVGPVGEGAEQPAVVQDQAVGVDQELGLEPVGREAPAVGGQALVALGRGQDLQAGELDPGHVQVGGLADLQGGQTPDGQGVGGRGDGEVDVEGPGDLSQLRAALPGPASGAVGQQDPPGGAPVQLQPDPAGQPVRAGLDLVTDVERGAVGGGEDDPGQPQPGRADLQAAAVQGAGLDVLPEDRGHRPALQPRSSSVTWKASSRAWLAFSRGSQAVSYRRCRWPSVISSAPPRHSVTSSPVSSTWMPPGWVPSERWTAKNPASSAMTSSKRRVLWPDGPTKVLPCIGSQAHTTGWPASRTARTSGGRSSSTREAPMRATRVSRPGTRPGSSRPHRATVSSGVAVGPSLAATGLPMPRRNSRWAPSSWRVRSPNHSRWAEQSYQHPVRLSRRVMACS